MKNRIIDPNLIERTCIFLKLLWEDISTEAKPLSIVKLADNYNIRYSGHLTHLLVEKGIIERKQLPIFQGNYCTYKWISKTEPNTKMAETLISLCMDHYRDNKKAHTRKWKLKIDSIGYIY